jgi:hypothetical protein
MNTFTNENYYKEQLRQAQRLRWAGLLCLLLVIAFSCSMQFWPQDSSLLVLLAYPFLFLGFPLWTMGSSRMKMLKSTPRPDLLLNTELKALNNKYTLHHFPRTESGYIKHLLVAPSGLLVMESRDTIGPVSCTSGPVGKSGAGDRWKDSRGWLDKIAGVRQPIGNPSNDLAAAMERAQGLLENVGKSNVPVKGLIVFTRQKDLELEACSYPAVQLDETKSAVRTLLSEMSGGREEAKDVEQLLTSDDRRRLNALLAPPQPVVQVKPAQAQRKA